MLCLIYKILNTSSGMVKNNTKNPKETVDLESSSRRDFLYLSATAMGAVGIGTAAIPLIKSMMPAEDTKAVSTVDVDVSAVKEGEDITIMWRGKPVFIRHRTPKEIEIAKNISLKVLPDPQLDEERVKDPKWLIVIGVCTHLGCIPARRKGEMSATDEGWLCACHGSKYDTSGRILAGPAPTNLEVPPYTFVNTTTLRIG